VAREWQAHSDSDRIGDSTMMSKGVALDRRTPVRDAIHEDARQTLATLRGCRQTINVVLVALTDGVELEVWAEGTLRRRSRFLRDTEARKYSERLAGRLLRRGYERGVPRLRAAQSGGR
jgi:hypothetical protein